MLDKMKCLFILVSQGVIIVETYGQNSIKLYIY